MEKLVINVSNAKSNIVKQVLHGLGVDVDGYTLPSKSDYKQKLLNISVWSDEDIKAIEDGTNLLNKFRAEQW